MAATNDEAGRRLLVTKISQAASREDIALYFSQFGLVQEVNLLQQPGGAAHSGIADVLFADPSARQSIIRQSPHQIHGADIACAPLELPAGATLHSFMFGGGLGNAGSSLVAAAPMPAPAQGMSVAPQVSVQADQVGVPPVLPSQVQAPAQSFDMRPPDQAGRLFVTKVPQALQREHLREHFAAFGELTDVYMPAVPGGGGHKGICFVSFAQQPALQAALQHTPHEILGHQVVVDVAAPRGEHPPTRATGVPLPVPAAVDVPSVPGCRAIDASPVGTGVAAGAELPAPPALVAAGVPGALAGPVGTHALLGATNLLGTTGLLGACGLMALGGPGNVALPRPPPPASTGTAVPGRLFLTRVTPDISKTDLQIYFQQFGQLQDVYIPTGKGIAFVSFTDPNVAQAVMQTSPQHFVKASQAVLVEQAYDRPPLGGKGRGAPSPPVNIGLNSINSGMGAFGGLTGYGNFNNLGNLGALGALGGVYGATGLLAPAANIPGSLSPWSIPQPEALRPAPY